MPSYLPPIKVRFAEKIAGTIRVRQGSIPAEAKLWDWLNPSGPTLIATITADEMGIFPAQTFPSISDNSAISFEVTKLVHPFDPLLTVPYFGTHLIYSQPLASDTVFELFLKQVAYADQCVVFFQNIPIIDATDIYEDPVEVELYVRFEQETEQSWTYLGNRIVGSETEINIPYGVLAPLWISAVPISAKGRRPAGALPENGSKLRVDLAATTAGNGVVVGQITDATQTNVTLGLSNIPAHARAIEYQTADDDDFTLNVKTTLLEGDVFGNFINRLPDVVSLNRAAGPDTKTIHFRMRFSTYNKAPFIIAPDDEAVAVPREGESAVWSPWSDFKTVTFADSSGAGGSPGDGINNYERNMIEVLEEESESDITVGVPMFGGGGSSGGGARWNNIASPNGNQYLVMGNYQTGWGFAHLGAGERDNINIGDDGSEATGHLVKLVTGLSSLKMPLGIYRANNQPVLVVNNAGRVAIGTNNPLGPMSSFAARLNVDHHSQDGSSGFISFTRFQADTPESGASANVFSIADEAGGPTSAPLTGVYISYLRDPTTYAGGSAVMVDTNATVAQNTGTFTHLRIKAPTVTSGKTLNFWEGVRVNKATGSGTITEAYIFRSEFGAGRVGIGTLVPRGEFENVGQAIFKSRNFDNPDNDERGSVWINPSSLQGIHLRGYGAEGNRQEIRFYKAGGVESSESDITSDQELGRISWYAMVSGVNRITGSIIGAQPAEAPGVFGVEISPSTGGKLIGVYDDGIYIKLGGDQIGDVHFRGTTGALDKVNRDTVAAGQVLTLATSGPNLIPTWAANSGGTPKWNAIQDPDGNQLLTMGNHSTGWAFAHTGEGVRDNVNIGDDGSVTTGHLLKLAIGLSSQKMPLGIYVENDDPALIVNNEGRVAVGTNTALGPMPSFAARFNVDHWSQDGSAAFYSFVRFQATGTQAGTSANVFSVSDEAPGSTTTPSGAIRAFYSRTSTSYSGADAIIVDVSANLSQNSGTVTGLRILAPTVGSGKILNFWEGLRFNAPTGAGTITTSYMIRSEWGSGYVGIGTLLPRGELEAVGQSIFRAYNFDNPDNNDRGSVWVNPASLQGIHLRGYGAEGNRQEIRFYKAGGVESSIGSIGSDIEIGRLSWYARVTGVDRIIGAVMGVQVPTAPGVFGVEITPSSGGRMLAVYDDGVYIKLGGDQIGDVHFRGTTGLLDKVNRDTVAAGQVLTLATSGANLIPTWAAPGAGSVKWNLIQDPDNNQLLTMGTRSTGWAFAHTSGSADNFNIGDDGSVATGYLVKLATGLSSQKSPLGIFRANTHPVMVVDKSGLITIGETSAVGSAPTFNARLEVDHWTQTGIPGFYSRTQLVHTSDPGAFGANVFAISDEATGAATNGLKGVSIQYTRTVTANTSVAVNVLDVTTTVGANTGTLRSIYIHGPVVSNTFTVSTWEGLRIGAGSGAGVITNPYPLLVEAGGKIGFGVTTPRDDFESRGTSLFSSGDPTGTDTGTVWINEGTSLGLRLKAYGTARSEMRFYKATGTESSGGTSLTAGTAELGRLSWYVKYGGVDKIAALVSGVQIGDDLFGVEMSAQNSSRVVGVYDDGVVIKLGADQTGDMHFRSTTGVLAKVDRTSIAAGYVLTLQTSGPNLIPGWAANTGGVAAGTGSEIQYRNTAGGAFAAIANSTVTPTNVGFLGQSITFASNAAQIVYLDTSVTSSGSSILAFYKSRNVIGNRVAAANGDYIGEISFNLFNTNVVSQKGASIQAQAQGTVDTGNWPTDLLFSTNRTTTNPKIALRLTSLQYAGFGADIQNAQVFWPVTVLSAHNQVGASAPSLVVYGSIDRERIELRSVGGDPIYMSKRAQGSPGVETPPADTNILGGFGASGYDGGVSGNHFNGWFNPQTGSVFFLAGGAWSTSSHPTIVTISTTAVGQTTRAERVRITDTLSTFNTAIRANIGDPGSIYLGESNLPQVRVYSYAVPGQLRFYKANNIQGAATATGPNEEYGRITWFGYNGSTYVPKGHIIGDVFGDNAGVTLTTEGNSRLFGVYANAVQLKLGAHTPGDLYYSTDTVGTLGAITRTTNGYVLTLVSGIPTWAMPTTGGAADGVGTELQRRDTATGLFAAVTGSSVNGPSVTFGGILKVSSGATSEIALGVFQATVDVKNFSDTQNSVITLLRQRASGGSVVASDILGVLNFAGRVGGLDTNVATIASYYNAAGSTLEIQPHSSVSLGTITLFGANLKLNGTISHYSNGTILATSPTNFYITSLQGAVRINEGNAAGSLRVYGFGTLPELRILQSTGTQGAEGAIGAGTLEIGRIAFYGHNGAAFNVLGTIKLVQPFSGTFGVEIQPNGSSNYVGVYTDGIVVNLAGTSAAGDMLYRTSTGVLARVDRTSIASGYVLTLNGSLLPTWQIASGGGALPAGNLNTLQYKATATTFGAVNSNVSASNITLTGYDLSLAKNAPTFIFLDSAVNDIYGSYVALYKSRGDLVNRQPAINGDTIGAFSFNVWNSTTTNNAGAQMTAEVTGTVSPSQWPSDIVFRTAINTGPRAGLRVTYKQYVGIGTDISNIQTVWPLTVISDGNQLAAASATLTVYGAIDRERIEVRSLGFSPLFMTKRGNGNAASITQVASGNIIGGLGASGHCGNTSTNHDSAGWYTDQAAGIFMVASETWSSTPTHKHGTYITLETTPVGSTTRAARLTIRDTFSTMASQFYQTIGDPGAVWLGESNLPQVRVYSFGVPGQLRFYKANNIQGAPQVTGSTEEWGRISWYAYDGFSYIPKSHIIGDNYLGNAGVTLTTEGNSRLFGVYANGIQLKLGTHQAGDLYYSIDTVGTLGRIAPGTATYVLTMVGTTPTWQAATGGGGSAQGTGSELQYRNPAGGGAFLALSGSSVSGPALTVGGTFKVTAGATSEVVLSTGTADIAAKTYSNSVSSSFTILRTLAGGVDVGSGDRLGAFRFMGRIGGIDREIANIYADYISTGPRLAFNPTAYTGTGAVIFLGNTVEFQGTFSEYTGGTLKSVSPMNFSISSLQGAVRINEGNATGNLRIYGYSTLPELRLHSSEGSMGAETITSSGRIELGRISFNRCISTNSYDPIATIKGVQPFPNIFGIEIQPNGSSNYIGVYTDGVYINMSGTNAAGDMLYRSSLNGPLTRVDRSSIAVGHVLTLNGSLMPSWQAPTGGGGSAGGGNNGEIQYKNGTGFAAEVALYYDSANDRLGVGAASTAEVTNAASKIYAKSTSTTETLLFLNCNQITAGSSPLIRVDMGTGSFPTVFQFDRNRAVFYGGPDGQYRKYGQIDLVLFASNGASSLTVSNIIPAGATVEGVVGRVTTAFSNIASFRVDDGVTVGLFATGVTNALNNTFTQINSTVWDGPRFFPTTRSLVVTANTTFGFVGQLKITIYYYQFNPHAQ